MENVQKVYITKEVADEVGLNAAYLIRLSKKLLENGEISENDMRAAGKRNYLFNDRALNVIKENIKRK